MATSTHNSKLDLELQQRVSFSQAGLSIPTPASATASAPTAVPAAEQRGDGDEAAAAQLHAGEDLTIPWSRPAGDFGAELEAAGMRLRP